MKRLHENMMAWAGSLLLLCAPAHQAAAAFQSVDELLNFVSMQEGTGNVVSSLFDAGLLPRGVNLDLTGIVRDQGWDAAVSTTYAGQPLMLSYHGNLIGTVGQTVQVTFQGVGVVRGQVFASSGTQTFVFDQALGDYVTLVHTELGQLENGRWGLAATEALAAGELVAAGFLANPNAGFTATIVPGGKGMAYSNVVFQPNAAVPPAQPPAPVFPAVPMPIPPNPGPGQEIMFFNGDEFGKFTPDIKIEGTYDDGVFGGTITSVPEPSMWLMLSLGGLLIAFGKSRSGSRDRLENRDECTTAGI